MSNRITAFLVLFLLVLAQSGAMFSATASGQAGSVYLFSNGAASVTVPLTANQTDTNFSIEVQRNVTFESAQFYINVDNTDVSPGQVSLDINEDGVKEWAFEDTGFGDLGHQNTFFNDHTGADIFSNGSAASMPFFIPQGSTLETAVASVNFVSEVASGLRQTGYVSAYDSGDFDNDSREEIVVLSRIQSITGSSAALSMFDWSMTTGVTTASWVPTCASSTHISVGDIDRDNHSDVLSFNPSNNLVCVHFFNSSTGNFGNATPISLTSGLISALLGDIDGNGQADILSIHQNGIVSLREYDSKRSIFSENATITLNQNGTNFPAQLVGFTGGLLNGPQGDFSLLVADSTGYSSQLAWSTSGISPTGDTMDGLGEHIDLADIDGDGDMDVFSANQQGYTIAEHTTTGWTATTVLSTISFANATVADHNNDGQLSVFIPNFESADGNAQTLDGNLSLYNISLTSVQSTSDELQPWTSPTDSMFVDLNGDGQMEHIVSAGEDTIFGLFIGSWESVSIDIDLDGQPDLSEEGYAGDGLHGTLPLSILDDLGSMTSLLTLQQSSQPSQPKEYDIEMTLLHFDLLSTGNGTFNISSMDFGYDMDFIVENNPAAQGNLTNIFNQLQTAGTGTIVIDLPFTSTKNGSLYLSNLIADYIPGAPNLALPPDPVLQLETLTDERVLFTWQDEFDFGTDFLDFEIFKASAGGVFDLNNPTFTQPINSTTDENIVPGESYDYAVRSLHLYGVTSNLSARLSVTIPYPAPPAAVQGMSVVDTPNDNGSSLSLSWDASLDLPLEYRIFVESTEIQSVDNLSALSTVQPFSGSYSTNITTTSNGALLVDRTDYWVAVVAYDEYGNASEQFTSIGPVQSLNNSLRVSTLSIAATTSGLFSETSFALGASDSLYLNVTLMGDDEPIPSQEVALYITTDAFNYSIQGTTDVNGVWNAISADELSQLSASFADFVGAASLTVAYAGTAPSATVQPADYASLSLSGMGLLYATLSHTSEPVALNETGHYSVEASLTPTLQSQTVYLANVEYDWELSNQSGAVSESGTIEVRGGKLSLMGTSDAHGTLSFSPSENQEWFSVTPETFSFTFAGHQANETTNESGNETTNQTNETTTPTFPETILPGVIDCGTATYAWENGTEDQSITCTVSNPNPFDVLLGFSWKENPTTPPPFTFEEPSLAGNEPNVTIPTNGSIQLEFTPVRNGPSDGLFPGLQGVGYTFVFTCIENGTNLCDSMTLSSVSTEGELQWTLQAQLEVDQPIDSEPTETKGGSNALVGGIIAVVLLALVGAAIVLLRSRQDDDDDWYEEGDELDESEEFAPQSSVNTPRGLGAIAADGDDFVARDPPEERRRSLFDEVDNRGEDEVVEYHDETEVESEASSSDDDGISVDENGTEWWEDEEGVWWYREQGWEDWAVWEE